ncbi:hypothetical protein COL22_14565 [Bacillus thuringiensis]|nr:hypothetical protein [Bacillus sp. RIT694]PFW09254.1 hypothetical protein COL22_14565 [Bacillus thuringiensis]RAN87114.1 hypothetical protein B5P41_25645 [Bacillus sp. SRB_28]
MIILFLIYVQPYENESLASFIFRTAKENFMEEPLWFLSLFTERYKHKLCESSLNWLDDIPLSEICEILKMNIQDAERMTFPNLLKQLHLPLKNKVKCPWIMYHTTKFCPFCIVEKQYHRIAWSLTYSHCCPKHNVFLIEKCVKCNKHITPRRIILDQCGCGATLSTFPVNYVEDLSLIEYQKIINNLFIKKGSFHLNKWITNHRMLFKSLEFFATWIPQILPKHEIPSIQNIAFSENVIARTRLKKEKSDQQALILYTYAYKLLYDWPNSYHNLIRTAENNVEDNNFSIFIKTALPNLLQTELYPIFKEFINYLGIYKLQTKDSLISLEEIPQLIKHFNKDIVESNYFHPLPVNLKDINLTVYKQKEIENWCNFYNESITKEEARSILGTSAKVTYQILSNNLIQDIAHKKNGSMTSWIIPIHALANFIKELKKQSVRTLEQKEIRTLNKAFEWIGYTNSHHLIRAMLEGKIKYIFNEKNLGNSVLPVHDIYTVIRNIMLKNAEIAGELPISNLTFLLGVKKSDIEHWIKTKRFGENKSLNAVTFENFHLFKKQYLTTYQLSHITGLSISQIIKKNYTGKIHSISGPKFNDGNKILFPINVLKDLQVHKYHF